MQILKNKVKYTDADFTQYFFAGLVFNIWKVS